RQLYLVRSGHNMRPWRQ
ncbi:hypothetical protein D043_1823B, partial [Vibrio parahaemolyticus EKP-021]